MKWHEGFKGRMENQMEKRNRKSPFLQMVIRSVTDMFVSDSLYNYGIRYRIEIKLSLSDLLIWAVGDPGFKPSQKQVSVEEEVWFAQMSRIVGVDTMVLNVE